MDVTLEHVLAGAKDRRAPVTPETAGYIALAVADALVIAPAVVREAHVVLSTEGAVLVAGAARNADSQAAEQSVRGLLSKLLQVAVGSAPALAKCARSPGGQGIDELVLELEAALIPVNRSAARRAIGRLAREAVRAIEQDRPLRASAPARRAPQPQPTRSSPPGPGYVPRSASAPPPSARPAQAPVRPRQPTPQPPISYEPEPSSRRRLYYEPPAPVPPSVHHVLPQEPEEAEPLLLSQPKSKVPPSVRVQPPQEPDLQAAEYLTQLDATVVDTEMGPAQALTPTPAPARPSYINEPEVLTPRLATYDPRSARQVTPSNVPPVAQRPVRSELERSAGAESGPEEGWREEASVLEAMGYTLPAPGVQPRASLEPQASAGKTVAEATDPQDWPVAVEIEKPQPAVQTPVSPGVQERPRAQSVCEATSTPEPSPSQIPTPAVQSEALALASMPEPQARGELGKTPSMRGRDLQAELERLEAGQFLDASDIESSEPGGLVQDGEEMTGPLSKRTDRVNELLATFAVSPARTSGEVEKDLMQIAGLDEEEPSPEPVAAHEEADDGLPDEPDWEQPPKGRLLMRSELEFAQPRAPKTSLALTVFLLVLALTGVGLVYLHYPKFFLGH